MWWLFVTHGGPWVTWGYGDLWYKKRLHPHFATMTAFAIRPLLVFTFLMLLVHGKTAKNANGVDGEISNLLQKHPDIATKIRGLGLPFNLTETKIRAKKPAKSLKNSADVVNDLLLHLVELSKKHKDENSDVLNEAFLNITEIVLNNKDTIEADKRLHKHQLPSIKKGSVMVDPSKLVVAKASDEKYRYYDPENAYETSLRVNWTNATNTTAQCSGAGTALAVGVGGALAAAAVVFIV